MRDIEIGRNYRNYSKSGFDINPPRIGFVRKVYGILSLQLVLTTLMSLMSMETNFGIFQQKNPGLLYAALIVNFITMIAVFCCGNLAKIVPTNYILLSIFTLTEAYMVSAICTVYDPTTVIIASAMTTAMTISLTIYACTTKTDITMYGGALFIAGCGLFLVCIFGFLFQNLIFQIIICVFCICLYGLYLIYDTQLIVGGERMYKLSLDDYIIGAIIIYIDIVVLFLRILQLVSYLRRRNN